LSRVAFTAAPWYAGEGPAVIAGEATWDFARLREAAARRAGLLRANGLIPGQLVLVPTDPPLDLVLMQHALACCNAALLPVRPGLSQPARAELVAMTGAEWTWVAAGSLGDSAGNGGQLVPLNPTARSDDASRWQEDPLALVIETSGSGGAPKAAMLTQGNVLASCARVNARLGLVPGDLWLCCLPRHHIGGLAIAYRCALAGAAILLHQGFDPAAVAADLARLPVTHVSLVPPMLARLLDLGVRPTSRLRVALVGGQALSGTLARRGLDAGWPMCATYGMTETCSQVATSGVLREVPGPGVVGEPLPGLTLDCPPCDQAPPGCNGPKGALRIRGDLVMAGYANPGRIRGLGLDGGWLTTADLGCLTAGGKLRVLGRADEALVIAGVQVLPALVTERLAGAPGVEAAVVIGLPNPVWGHSLVAVYAGTIAPADLTDWCRRQLAGVERPRHLRRVAALPVLASGKYDLQAIRRLVEAASCRSGTDA